MDFVFDGADRAGAGIFHPWDGFLAAIVAARVREWGDFFVGRSHREEEEEEDKKLEAQALGATTQPRTSLQ
jgi:hypothetical protein